MGSEPQLAKAGGLAPEAASMQRTDSLLRSSPSDTLTLPSHTPDARSASTPATSIAPLDSPDAGNKGDVAGRRDLRGAANESSGLDGRSGLGISVQPPSRTGGEQHRDTRPLLTGGVGDQTGDAFDSLAYSQHNVYIRGLGPEATEHDLVELASRIAWPESVKVRRERGPESSAAPDVSRDDSAGNDAARLGPCTGVGFVRFARTVEAKAFIDLVNTDTSYSACFAKETFLGRMQRASDPGSANVYISHLPMTFTQLDLASLFPTDRGYEIASLRMLHEGDEPGRRTRIPNARFRGAAFIRFTTREMAYRAIEEFNGKLLVQSPTGQFLPIPGDSKQRWKETLQVRFADSDAQKRVKAEAERTMPKEMLRRPPQFTMPPRPASQPAAVSTAASQVGFGPLPYSPVPPFQSDVSLDYPNSPLATAHPAAMYHNPYAAANGFAPMVPYGYGPFYGPGLPHVVSAGHAGYAYPPPNFFPGYGPPPLAYGPPMDLGRHAVTANPQIVVPSQQPNAGSQAHIGGTSSVNRESNAEGTLHAPQQASCVPSAVVVEQQSTPDLPRQRSCSLLPHVPPPSPDVGAVLQRPPSSGVQAHHDQGGQYLHGSSGPRSLELSEALSSLHLKSAALCEETLESRQRLEAEVGETTGQPFRENGSHLGPDSAPTAHSTEIEAASTQHNLLTRPRAFSSAVVPNGPLNLLNCSPSALKRRSSAVEATLSAASSQSADLLMTTPAKAVRSPRLPPSEGLAPSPVITGVKGDDSVGSEVDGSPLFRRGFASRNCSSPADSAAPGNYSSDSAKYSASLNFSPASSVASVTGSRANASPGPRSPEKESVIQPRYILPFSKDVRSFSLVNLVGRCSDVSEDGSQGSPGSPENAITRSLGRRTPIQFRMVSRGSPISVFSSPSDSPVRSLGHKKSVISMAPPFETVAEGVEPVASPDAAVVSFEAAALTEVQPGFSFGVNHQGRNNYEAEEAGKTVASARAAGVQSTSAEASVSRANGAKRVDGGKSSNRGHSRQLSKDTKEQGRGDAAVSWRVKTG